MHVWLPSQLNSKECAKCARPYIQHLAPICESCGLHNKECEIFGRLDDPRAMLLCPDCTSQEVKANDITISKTQVLIENPPFASLTSTTSSESLIEESKAIDTAIRYNGDVFNAHTISFAALKASILSDESIGSLQERHFKYHEVIAERLLHLKSVVFELDNKKHEAISEQLAARESLREYGNSIREEIREKIKASDASYQPHQIIKAPKIKKPVVGTFDRLIEAFSLMHGVSKEVAEEMIRKGRSTKQGE